MFKGEDSEQVAAVWERGKEALRPGKGVGHHYVGNREPWLVLSTGVTVRAGHRELSLEAAGGHDWG